jgi:hypothetical protein
MAKKSCGSNPGKQRNVQASLEAKVERAKGFHAFFVPLARTLPPAPPSSPVLQAAQPRARSAFGSCSGSASGAGMDAAATGPSRDYFGSWDKKGNEQWVEDVDDGMDLDSE